MSSRTQACILPPGGLADEVSAALAALFLQLPSVFSHTPTHEATHTYTESELLCHVVAEVLNLISPAGREQVQQNSLRCTWSLRGSEWNGQAWHGTSAPSANQLTTYLHGPRGAHLQSAQWP